MISNQQCNNKYMILLLSAWVWLITGRGGVVMAKTWRPMVTTTTSQLVRMRGGEHKEFSSDVPQVPDATTTSCDPIKSSNNLPQVETRGGSTSTRHMYPTPTGGGGYVSIPQQPASTSSSSIVQQQQTANTTVVEKKELAVSKKEIRALEKKAHKRHKQIAKKLKNRNATNFRRKILHSSFGFFFAALNHVVPKAKFVPGMAVLTSFALFMELMRYRKGFGWMNEALHFVLGDSLRKHEMDGKFTGSFYYFLGVTITSWLYPTSCATLGICQLAIADPTASYFGRATRHVYWSRIENGLGGFGRNKGILGFLGGAVACVPMNYRLLSIAQFGTKVVSQQSLIAASFALGFAGAFADLAVPTPALTLPKRIKGIRVPPFHVDDNVVVPIFSGFACQQIFRMLHYPADLALGKYLFF